MKDIPDYALVYRNSAKLQGWMCECGIKLEEFNNNLAECKVCGKKYEMISKDKVKCKR